MTVEPYQAIEHAAQSLVKRGILTLRAVDPDSFTLAGSLLRDVKEYLAKVDQLCDSVIKATNAAHKAAVDQKRKLAAPGLEAERHLKGEIGAYHTEQQRLHRAAEAHAIRERERLAQQAHVVATEQSDKLTKAAEDQRLEAALAAEAQGDGALAERLVSDPVAAVRVMPDVAFVPPPPPIQKLEAATIRGHFRAKVTNLKALVDAISRGEQPLSYVEASMTTLNGVARALKSELNIPGVEAVEEATVASRR